MDKKSVLNELWTSRWYLGKGHEKEAMTHLSNGIDILEGKEVATEVDDEPDRPSPGETGKGLLWYPKAVRLDFDMKTQGVHHKGYPEIALVHHTAGRCDTEADMIATMKWGRDQGYAFLGIGPTGVVYQAHPLNRWGWHAGASTHPDFGGFLSKFSVGIEVAAAGSVDASGKAWFGQKFPPERLRKADPKIHGVSGTFVKFTEAQEVALIEVIQWLIANKPDVLLPKYVLGHHEVSPGRKNDPGGSLSMGMGGLREKVAA